jgi:NMD protein affecting ribosome stability and mRNA decay
MAEERTTKIEHCPRCGKPLEPRPIFLNTAGQHICDDCWVQDRHDELEGGYDPTHL